jgi:hypothetical protein
MSRYGGGNPSSPIAARRVGGGDLAAGSEVRHREGSEKVEQAEDLADLMRLPSGAGKNEPPPYVLEKTDALPPNFPKGRVDASFARAGGRPTDVEVSKKTSAEAFADWDEDGGPRMQVVQQDESVQPRKVAGVAVGQPKWITSEWSQRKYTRTQSCSSPSRHSNSCVLHDDDVQHALHCPRSGTSSRSRNGCLSKRGSSGSSGWSSLASLPLQGLRTKMSFSAPPRLKKIPRHAYF